MELNSYTVLFDVGGFLLKKVIIFNFAPLALLLTGPNFYCASI